MARPMFLELDEVEALMEAPNVKSMIGLRNRCIMGLMFEGGLRISEVLSLRPRDINLNERRIEVLRGKGAKPRTVYFRTQSLGEYLERWKKIRPEGEFLFTIIRGSSRGNQVSVRNLENAVRHYAKLANIPVNVTPHLLRHSFATHLLRRGVNIRIVQEALGHKNLSTTQIYTHVVNADVREALRGES